MDDICKNIEEYIPSKKCKILIVFDDMIAEMLNNKKLNPIITVFVISCFYYKILFCRAKKYETKFCALFFYANFKQRKA